MKIRVKPYLTLKKTLGDRSVLEVDVEDATIRRVLDTLSERYGKGFSDIVYDPKTKDISKDIRVLVNGRHYNYLPKRLDAKLKEGDEVALFPQVAGG
ncbi:MAG TPA: MoaD/ThiS family protein [Acidobacteriota bacterium]|nr:MoaD/ThiS family protein [Acidobacteriota bacterium]